MRDGDSGSPVLTPDLKYIIGVVSSINYATRTTSISRLSEVLKPVANIDVTKPGVIALPDGQDPMAGLAVKFAEYIVSKNLIVMSRIIDGKTVSVLDICKNFLKKL